MPEQDRMYGERRSGRRGVLEGETVVLEGEMVVLGEARKAKGRTRHGVQKEQSVSCVGCRGAPSWLLGVLAAYWATYAEARVGL